MDQEYVSSMVDDIIDGDNLAAKEKFEDLIASRVFSALDQRKIEIAQRIYQDDQPEEESEEESDQ